jgi:hypothetical protein
MSTPEEQRAREIAEVLAYAAACDPRLNTSDAQQAQARVVAWMDMLTGVPIEYVRDRVRVYYRSDHAWPITAGSIRDRWLREQARASQPALVAHAGTPVTDLPDGVREQLTGAVQEIRRQRAVMGYS